MHNLYELDQGTILYGMKSSKYPDTKCYGIIITASCDIANQKVSKYYFLFGVDVDDWFKSSYAFQHIFMNEISKKKNAEIDKITSHGYDARFLLMFTDEEIDEVLSKEKKNAKNDIISSVKTLRKADEIKCIDDLKDTDIIKTERIITGKLTEIAQRRDEHYYFLPKAAYNKSSEEKNNGLIIDLQEIGFILPNEADVIIKNRGIDMEILSKISAEQAAVLKTDFFLDKEDAIVDVEGVISSPWREHLMQSFSHGFIRIGVDAPQKTEFEDIAKRIAKEC